MSYVSSCDGTYLHLFPGEGEVEVPLEPWGQTEAHLGQSEGLLRPLRYGLNGFW